METELARVARDKLVRVFRYLEALNQHRNPAKRQIRDQLWTLWLDTLPDHPSIIRRTRIHEPLPETETLEGSSSVEKEYVLKVRRPHLTSSPEPPDGLSQWVERGWDDPSSEISIRPTKNETDALGHGRLINFDDDPARSAALEIWKRQRNSWATAEKPARAAMKVFETLYGLYGRMEREAEKVELVLGDGVLAWKRPEGGILHPILLQRLRLEFNASVPEFTLAEADVPVELYSALLQSIPEVDGRAIGRCREELEQGDYRPLGDDATSGFLRRLIVQLSPRGEFRQQGPRVSDSDDPRIGRDAVVFLRNRTLGFAAAIEGVLADLRTREDLPWSLVNIVGEQLPITDRSENLSGAKNLPLTDNDVLLSKPANPEQIRIAKQLDQHPGVLVQGPPGTGKTHTIANLIGHLLAQGKSVLVTSHTTKALRMVRRHLVSELQPLCVSVLESDLESRSQLEASVGSIAERLSRTNGAALEEEAIKLEVERRALLNELESLRLQLIKARSDEYRDVIVGGKPFAPAEAARKISGEAAINAWIPGPIVPGTTLPLSTAEFIELYQTNKVIGRDDESELANHLPGLNEVISPAEFRSAVLERNELENQDLSFGAKYWASNAYPSLESITNLNTKLVAAVQPLLSRELWKLDAVYAGRYGGEHKQPWEQLVRSIRSVHAAVAKAQETLLALTIEPSLNHTLEEQEQIVTEIIDYLSGGGDLGFFAFLTHRSWKTLAEATRVNGKAPHLLEHFRGLRTFTQLRIARRDLASRWDRQVAIKGGESSSRMGSEVEKTLVQFCDPIENCLSWFTNVWSPCEKELKGIGFLWDQFLNEQPVIPGNMGELSRLAKAVSETLPNVLATRFNKVRLNLIDHFLQHTQNRLVNMRNSSPTSELMASLADSVCSADPQAYEVAFGQLSKLSSRKKDFDLRKNLLNKLEKVAPAWGAHIRNRAGVHGMAEIPGDPNDAWIWQQLAEELERRSSVSIEDLQSKRDKLQNRLREVTVELIDKKAWSFQTKRTSSKQRQALIGWLDTIRRIGKGTGVRAPGLRAEAARKMSECRGAVPVWVMPLSRVVENFDPRSSRFDVVIVDEASQSDVMALVALYLGKTVLVVGDHEQVSPTAVGQNVGIIQNLIHEHLDGIPNAHLYDGQISIYDLARQSFEGTTCLVEHFRCVPEIIQFSNRISYEGRIKPLRDASSVVLRPHTISFRVDGAVRDEKINSPEALAVTSLICAAVEQQEYLASEASFGVVSLLGEEQAIEIDRMLRDHLPPKSYERHRLLCGNAAQFQGDERDVVFLSMVDTAGHGPLSLRDRQLFKQRFNVAASRARDQMWVVHSLNPQKDLKADDLRRLLIEHVEDPSLLMRVLEDKSQRVESEFERQVLKRLLIAGYRVTPQWRVGAYRIDMVVDGNGRRLAVECDGDRYHPLESLGDDMERQAILERMGWTFSRIRGSDFFRDPDRALRPVFDKLEALDIGPTGHEGYRPSVTAFETDLIQRVIRRAEEFRISWSQPPSNAVLP